MPKPRRRQPRTPLEPLESRTLFTATLTQPFDDVILGADTVNAPLPIDLTAHLTDPDLPAGTPAIASIGVRTNGGTAVGTGVLHIALFGNTAPETVTRFEQYLLSGAYNGTVFSEPVTSTTPPTVIGGYIAGGSFYASNLIQHVTTITPAVPSEAGVSNGPLVIGLNPNGSDFVFGRQDVAQQPISGYQFFGKVLNDQAASNAGGTGTLQKLQTLPRVSTFASQNPSLVSVIVSPPANTPPAAATASDIVTLSGGGVLPLLAAGSGDPAALTYTVSSDNPSLVFPKVSNGVLTLGRSLQRAGTANVTVLLTDINGNFAGDTFQVIVPSVDPVNPPATDPDLAVTSVSKMPKKVVYDEAINVSAKVQNASKSSGATGPFNVSFYISSDSTFDATDRPIATVAVPGLAGGQSTTASANGVHLNSDPTLPKLPNGFYFLIARADSDAVVTERVETNNAKSSKIAGTILSDLPDLEGKKVSSPGKVAINSSFGATVVIKNSGPRAAPATQAVTLSFFASSNQEFDNTDIPLGDVTVPQFSLAAGNSDPISVLVPNNTQQAFARFLDDRGERYHLVVIIDADNAVTEGNEINNVAVGKGTFSVQS